MDAVAAWSPKEDRPAPEEQKNSIQKQEHLASGGSESETSFLKELAGIFGLRNWLEDKKNDAAGNDKYLAHPELEANISKLTKNVFLKDADSVAPVQNTDGSTTYTLVQIGLSNRKESVEQGSDYYRRNISVTVPADAKNLSECSFNYDERKAISEEEFNEQLNHDRKRLFELNQENKTEDVAFYAHGIYTGEKLADSQAMLLELTNGRPTINVDWSAYPYQTSPDFSVTSYLRYIGAITSARSGERYLSPLIDKAVDNVGPAHSVMIGYSHGGMFNTRYLRHRIDNGLPKVQTSLMAHPDVPIVSPELSYGNEVLGLLSATAERSIVLGGQSDKTLFLSRFTPFVLGSRLGNDSTTTRRLLEKQKALSITEYDRKSPGEDQHHLNYAGIASILNGSKSRALAEIQSDFTKASEQSRRK